MEKSNDNKMNREKHFPSHFGEVYDAMPEKFEKRTNKTKPLIFVLFVLFSNFSGIAS